MCLAFYYISFNLFRHRVLNLKIITAKHIDVPALHNIGKELIPIIPKKHSKTPEIIRITARNFDAPEKAQLFFTDCTKRFSVLFILNKHKNLNKMKGSNKVNIKFKGVAEVGLLTSTSLVCSVKDITVSITAIVETRDKTKKTEVNIKTIRFTTLIIFIPVIVLEESVIHSPTQIIILGIINIIATILNITFIKSNSGPKFISKSKLYAKSSILSAIS